MKVQKFSNSSLKCFMTGAPKKEIRGSEFLPVSYGV
jgi:hypothetical protein